MLRGSVFGAYGHATCVCLSVGACVVCVFMCSVGVLCIFWQIVLVFVI